VAGALNHLASALCAKLARAGRGCRRLALWVARADGSSTVIEAGLSAPSREPSHLLRLIEDKIQELDMGFGVDLMSLAALVTETLLSTSPAGPLAATAPR
jgi:protein ImuB